MRTYSRSLLAAALACAALACSDTGTRVTSTMRPFRARLSFAPQWSPEAVTAYKALESRGLLAALTIKIKIYTLSGEIAADTTVTFPDGQSEISIDVFVNASTKDEQMDANIELRDSNGLLQFASFQRVTAKDSDSPTSSSNPPQTVTLKYVGPGFTVKSISVSPGDAVLEPGRVQDVIMTAFDDGGRGVNDVAVTWSSSDPNIATVAPTAGAGNARVTPRGPRGTVTITATSTSGISGSARVTILPTPLRLSLVAGGGQTGPGGQNLPVQFTVELVATDGKVMGGQLINFRALNEGSVGIAVGSTQATDGRASTLIKPGRTPGLYNFEASFPGLAPVTISATATTPPVVPPTQILAISNIPQSYQVGVPSSNFVAQLADVEGNHVKLAGVSVTATAVVTPGNATYTSSATSDANGQLIFSIPTFTTAGTVFFAFTSPTIPNLPYGSFPIRP
ncbi:MAG: Ig-like domain-containing protein [Gemmatimonadota bacterium]